MSKTPAGSTWINRSWKTGTSSRRGSRTIFRHSMTPSSGRSPGVPANSVRSYTRKTRKHEEHGRFASVSPSNRGDAYACRSNHPRPRRSSCVLRVFVTSWLVFDSREQSRLPSQPRVDGRELDAVQKNHSLDVDPHQEHDHDRDGSIDPGELTDAAFEVPVKSLERHPP